MNEKTVVVAWDFSSYAKAALEYAVKNFEPEAIRVLCVLERPDPYAFGLDWEPTAEATTHKNCFEDYSEEEKAITRTKLKFDTRFGDPASHIVQFANEVDADAIVMSTHGRTGFNRLVMGSVTQKVLANAGCAVVVLPNRYVNFSPERTENQVANSS